VTVRDWISKTVGPSNTYWLSNKYDFSAPVLENITLFTSWTGATKQVFTFTVGNTVTGDPSRDFTYTLSLADLAVNRNGKTYGLNDGEAVQGIAMPITTMLRNGETFTVRITVLKEPRGSWNGYDVMMSVIDRDGTVIADDHVFEYKDTGNNINYESSEYRYKLIITQEQNLNFSSDVAEQGSEDLFTENSEALTAVFESGFGTAAAFSGWTNGFVDGQEKAAAVMFTNVCYNPAPTGWDTSRAEGAHTLILLGGALLLCTAFLAARRRRRKSEA